MPSEKIRRYNRAAKIRRRQREGKAVAPEALAWLRDYERGRKAPYAAPQVEAAPLEDPPPPPPADEAPPAAAAPGAALPPEDGQLGPPPYEPAAGAPPGAEAAAEPPPNIGVNPAEVADAFLEWYSESRKRMRAAGWWWVVPEFCDPVLRGAAERSAKRASELAATAIGPHNTEQTDAVIVMAPAAQVVLFDLLQWFKGRRQEREVSRAQEVAITVRTPEAPPPPPPQAPEEVRGPSENGVAARLGCVALRAATGTPYGASSGNLARARPSP